MLVEVTFWLIVKWTIRAGQIASSQRPNLIAIEKEFMAGHYSTTSVQLTLYVIL